MERALQGKTYLVGDSFSQADISMYPRIAMYEQIGSALDESRYPNVLRWMKLLSTRPSFEASQTAEAKKIAAFASSNMLKKVREALKVEKERRSVFHRVLLWGVARLLRRMLGVEALLDSKEGAKSLYIAETEVGLEARKLGDLKHQPSSPGSLKLYGDARSPYTLRVSLLLQALGLAFKSVDVPSGEGNFLPEDMLALNPQRELPVLTDGDRVICGADTIADYLCQSVEESPLLWRASDSVAGSRSRMWLALEAGSHKEFTPLWRRYVCGEDSVYFIASEETALGRIHGQLGILEYALSSSEFLCADLPGYADIVWYSRLSVLVQVPQFSLEELPALEAWALRMKAKLRFD